MILDYLGIGSVGTLMTVGKAQWEAVLGRLFLAGGAMAAMASSGDIVEFIR